MPQDFRSLRFTFPSASGAPQRLERTITFSSAIRRVECCLNGFDVGFTDIQRPFYRLAVDVEVMGFLGNACRIRATLGLRDSTGAWDDAFEGRVDVMVWVDRV